ncbi:hypothetical protein [Brevundimonas sp. SGAir0440]|uniref:hypothetical protein n=1 Tax=Brevundimonas sp. SGAir0440 TaxID=2579977 RepID=UPI0010CD03FF|nr:hypothetical protein [Brevundimonas sp. SGAir0440]QCQ98510.1 hypothetical protein E7T10_07435 [Brevundimonas sp. SGAir0440]
MKTIAATAALICIATAANAQTLTRQDQNILGSPDAVRTSVAMKINMGSISDTDITSASLHRRDGKHYVCGTMNFRGQPQRFVLSYAHNGPSGREFGSGPHQAFVEFYNAQCGARTKLGDFDL